MPPGYQDPESTVFISNIEGRVTEEILWELFLQAGPLRNVHIPIDRASKKNKTFAFVTFRHSCSVEFACHLFNTLKLFKKPIYCKPTNDGNKSANNSSSTGSPNYSTPVRPNYPASSSRNMIPPLFNQDYKEESTRNEIRKDYDSGNRGDEDRNRTSFDERGRSGDDRGYSRSSGGRGNYDNNEELTRYDPRNDDRSGNYYRDDRNYSCDNNSRINYNNMRSPNGPGPNPFFIQAMNNYSMNSNQSHHGGSGNYNNHNSSNSRRDNYVPNRNNDPIQRHRMNRRQRSQPY